MDDAVKGEDRARANTFPATTESPSCRHNGHSKFRGRKRSAHFAHGSKGAKRPVHQSQTFLLGGTLDNPLNLSGFENELSNVELIDAQASEEASTSHASDVVDILIPKNPKDPLNLQQEHPTSAAGSKQHRKRKRYNSLKIAEVEKEFSIDKDDKKSGYKNALSDSEIELRESEATPAKRSLKLSELANKSSVVEKVAGDKKKKEKFRYGNYSRYYGKRIGRHVATDPRMSFLKRDWFDGRHVLDVGCNAGHLTISIAQEFGPRRIIGVDIDPYLVNLARRNLRMHLHYAELERLDVKFPPSFVEEYGPIVAPPLPSVSSRINAPFPQNVIFRQSNYVLDSDVLLETVCPEYDTIVAFSLTKWIHLNWGDDGLKRFFKRAYLNLRPGGAFLLESQPFASYKKRKSICPEVLQHYKSIKLFPNHFADYLLSTEVGFQSRIVVGTPEHSSKGFQRPIEMYIK